MRKILLASFLVGIYLVFPLEESAYAFGGPLPTFKSGVINNTPRFETVRAYSYQIDPEDIPVRCRGRSILRAAFSDDQLVCSTKGWTFPGLIWGECPVVVCMLK